MEPADPKSRSVAPVGSGQLLEAFRDDAQSLAPADFEARHGDAFLLLSAARPRSSQDNFSTHLALLGEEEGNTGVLATWVYPAALRGPRGDARPRARQRRGDPRPQRLAAPCAAEARRGRPLPGARRGLVERDEHQRPQRIDARRRSSLAAGARRHAAPGLASSSPSRMPRGCGRWPPRFARRSPPTRLAGIQATRAQRAAAARPAERGPQRAPRRAPRCPTRAGRESRSPRSPSPTARTAPHPPAPGSAGPAVRAD